MTKSRSLSKTTCCSLAGSAEARGVAVGQWFRAACPTGQPTAWHRPRGDQANRKQAGGHHESLVSTTWPAGPAGGPPPGKLPGPAGNRGRTCIDSRKSCATTAALMSDSGTAAAQRMCMHAWRLHRHSVRETAATRCRSPRSSWGDRSSDMPVVAVRMSRSCASASVSRSSFSMRAASAASQSHSDR